MTTVPGLTPTETEQLDSAFKQTKRRLDDLMGSVGTGQVSADGKKLIVTVPPIPTEGSMANSTLINTLKQVLGPERYQLFNDVTGESFDRSFDRFGLNNVSHEVSSEPLQQPGPQNYAFKQSFASTDGSGSSGWSNGNLDRAGLAKSFPVLARFLSPGLIK